MNAILSLAMGYFVGCINPAAWVGKKKHVDLKQSGTGNLGATNTALVLGKNAGYFVLFFDIFKSFFSYKAARLLFPRLAATAGLLAGIGVLLGCYGGYKGGLFDKIVLRLSEIFMSFPQLILVMMLGTIFGRGLWNLIFIFILTGWGGVYRQARAKMLSLREEEYVQSMRAFGLSDMVIAYKHMLPNAVGPVVVNLTLSTAMFILDEAAMSFLGLGVPPEIATWGNILNAAQDLYVMQNYWWLWLPVGIVVSLFVISVNCIGDGLRDSTDPTQQG